MRADSGWKTEKKKEKENGENITPLWRWYISLWTSKNVHQFGATFQLQNIQPCRWYILLGCQPRRIYYIGTAFLSLLSWLEEIITAHQCPSRLLEVFFFCNSLLLALFQGKNVMRFFYFLYFRQIKNTFPWVLLIKE